MSDTYRKLAVSCLGGGTVIGIAGVWFHSPEAAVTGAILWLAAFIWAIAAVW